MEIHEYITIKELLELGKNNHCFYVNREIQR